MNQQNIKLSKKTLNYLKENDFIVIKKQELEKFKFFNYKEPVEEMIENICNFFFSRFKEKVRIYCSEEISEVKKVVKEDIRYTIENFMEIVYNFRPSYKKVWSGKALTDKTMRAIKRHKVFEVVYEKEGSKFYVDCCLILNRKRALKTLENLKPSADQPENGKFTLVEKKIN